MKRFFVFLFWVVFVIIAIHQATSLKTVRRWWAAQNRSISKVKKMPASKLPKFLKSAHVSQLPFSSNSVTLYLKNGSVLSGELVHEGDQGVTLFWQGGEVVFTRKEIEKIQKGEFHPEKGGLLFPEELPEK